MPDDLLTTVKAWLRKLDTRLIATKQPETDTLAVILEDLPCTVSGWLRALLARCEAAEAERDEWYERFAQLESHRASCCWRMEQERDAARAEADQLHTVRKRRDDEIAGLEDALAAERIEVVHLREAFVTMERAANEREAELNALREQRKQDAIFFFEAGHQSGHDDCQRGDGERFDEAWARREP